MTRHGNNATNSAVYSYHERKKDQAAAGYGAEKMRLSKDAIKVNRSVFILQDVDIKLSSTIEVRELFSVSNTSERTQLTELTKNHKNVN